MKIVIAGVGEIGMHLTKMFSEVGNHNITIIDLDAERIDFISAHYDILTHIGSATSISDLKEIEIHSTNLFIAVTEKEETNITACVLAKKLGAKKTIARIDNQDYVGYQNQKLLQQIGVDNITYPQRLVALEISNLIRETGVTESIEFSGGKLSLNAIKLDDNADIIGKQLDEIKSKKSNVYRAVAIERGDQTIIPTGKNTFQINDLVYVLSSKEGLEDLMKVSGKQQYNVRNVMILGGSRVGLRTARELQHHFNVKLIDIDEKKCLKAADYLDNTLIINGDGRDIELLEDEGIKEMDAFIAVTNNSETNIIACLLAKKLGVKRTIADIENIDYIQIAENIGIDTIVNKKLLAASSIFTYTLSAQVQSMKCLIGTDAEILEFVAREKSKITKKPLRKLEFPANSIIGGVIRNNTSLIATGDTIIQAQDKVIIFALADAVSKLEKLFL